MQWMPAGDRGILIDFSHGEFATQRDLAARIYQIFEKIRRQPAAKRWNIVPSYTTLMISYGPEETPSDVLSLVAQTLLSPPSPRPARTFLVPFCIDGAMAPDLPRVALAHDLAPSEVIALFTSQAYRIDAIGFSPGFPYLSGLPAPLATPRLSSPRPRVPAGSVAIGGAQAGVYPLSTPGGWNIIGQTPVKLFDPARTVPIVYRPGDFLQFVVVSPEEFESLTNQPPRHLSSPVAP